MDWLQSYDWITPTNPFAAMFFGALFTVIISLFLWFDSKDKRIVGITVVTGLIVTVSLVGILQLIGFYE